MADFTLDDLGMVEEPDYMLPPGRYVAELRAIEPINTARGRTLKFRFQVEESSKHQGVTVTGLTDTNLKPGNKLCEWIKVLRGKAVKPGEKIKWDDLNGSRVIILVDHTSPKRENVSVFANVVAIYPLDSPEPLDEDSVEE